MSDVSGVSCAPCMWLSQSNFENNCATTEKRGANSWTVQVVPEERDTRHIAAEILFQTSGSSDTSSKHEKRPSTTIQANCSDPLIASYLHRLSSWLQPTGFHTEHQAVKPEHHWAPQKNRVIYFCICPLFIFSMAIASAQITKTSGGFL